MNGCRQGSLLALCFFAFNVTEGRAQVVQGGSATGLHKLMGGRPHHAHPECVACFHFEDGGPDVWADGFEGRCDLKAKTLCCIKSRPCPEWRRAPAPGFEAAPADPQTRGKENDHG